MSEESITAVDQCPKLAEAIGRVVGNWAVAENFLQLLVADLLHISYDAAADVWFNFISVSSKLDMLKRLNTYHNKTNIRDEITEALDLATSINAKRNRFVHSLWLCTDTENLFMIKKQSLPRTSQKIKRYEPEPVTLAEIESVVADIHQLTSRLMRIDTQLCVMPAPLLEHIGQQSI